MSLIELLALVKKYGPLLQQALPLIKEIIVIFRSGKQDVVGDMTLDEFCEQSGLPKDEAQALAEAPN